MIHIIALKNCVYCDKALELLKKKKIKYKKTLVDQKNKEDIKKKYSIKTFPFIRIILENKEKLIIDGFKELEQYIDICDKIRDKNLNVKIILNLLKNI